MALTNEAHVKFQLATFITVIVFVIGTTAAGLTAYFKIKEDVKSNLSLITYNTGDIEEHKTIIKDLNKEVEQVKINEAKIFTELSNITERQVRMLDILQKK